MLSAHLQAGTGFASTLVCEEEEMGRRGRRRKGRSKMREEVGDREGRGESREVHQCCPDVQSV